MNNISEDLKIFCIGVNKTGTTSIGKALSDLGYILDNQSNAQSLLNFYFNRDFGKIIQYCKSSSQCFQDAPFGHHYTFMFLDQFFVNAKFILTIRDSADEWYESLLRFHTSLFSTNQEPPTAKDLKNAKRPTTGESYLKYFLLRFNTPLNDLYNKNILCNYYFNHNRSVIEYFRTKKNLLVINLKEENSYESFCKFLNIEKSTFTEFPWLNRTK